jgi:hypothetical protein
MTHQEAVSTLASERYLLEEMTELERHAFEDHFFDCPECADDVRAGAYLRECARPGMRAQGTGQPAPSSSVVAFPSKPAPRKIPTFIPWAAAATLALVSGYQALFLGTGRSGPGFEPQALAPVALRPASRGAEAVVVVEPDKPVALALDVNIGANAGRPAAELEYDLRTIDGPSILSGRAPAPEAGSPLFLLVPGASLSAPGRYLLTVADSTGQAIGEYRFATKTR